MGENKNNQMFSQAENNQQEDYGSQFTGRHNHEGTPSHLDPSALDKENEKGDINPSMEQQNRVNLQNQGSQNNEENFSDSLNDDLYEYGQYTSRSQMNEIEDGNMVAKVEGDDKDILGDTENSQRNQQRMRERESNQGSPHNR